jgi:ActR/RegA family two-component response regulator
MPNDISLLFVDDEESIRLTLPLLLERQGFKVTVAGTVPEALKLIGERKFQVLIADLNINHPGDGFAVVSAMRSTQPDALRFVLTGYPAFESALEAMRQQVDDYLIKPADIQRLVNSVKSKMGKRTPARLLPPRRLPEVISENLTPIMANFLRDAKADAEISSIPMSDSERTDHIPRLLNAAMRMARHEAISAEDRESSVLHGALRRKQGYSVPLLIREARILKKNVAECLQEHLLEVDISYLVRDIVTSFGTIDTLLEESVEAFLRPPRAHPVSVARGRQKNGRKTGRT